MEWDALDDMRSEDEWVYSTYTVLMRYISRVTTRTGIDNIDTSVHCMAPNLLDPPFYA